MEPYRLRVPGRIEELVRGLHPDLKRKVRAGLDLIRTDPEVGKELRDELAGLRSLRVGRLRIVYRVAARRLIDLSPSARAGPSTRRRFDYSGGREGGPRGRAPLSSVSTCSIQ